MKKISLSIKFGLITSIVLIAYFLILALFNKHINPAYSFFNAIITTLGIYEAIRFTKLENPEAFSYGEGFKTGLITGFIATILFTGFFLLYATEFNPDFLPELLKKMQGGLGADVGLITFVVAIMGFATTLVATLAVMQHFKNSKNLA
ncbi:hypothetical protein CJ739_1313 [Mariniflexile rhizosphaerae]|uniref:DUF4199 domain-containing protein n=1 Tax=unclassified Mariniflexile TaxID=2643887 RepID=UPI000CCA3409|nr:DUF4199 domain-containing protein [Mariniflexile sp. TRM1-10]AXP80404.1 hypothetical protein CJ739_1313 [Mariniflexile sp. TRM1-10]PLB20577.1 MAG: putative membrane protein [Flavobacteriaceae bacterium FS1-H7996/R]